MYNKKANHLETISAHTESNDVILEVRKNIYHARSLKVDGNEKRGESGRT